MSDLIVEKTPANNDRSYVDVGAVIAGTVVAVGASAVLSGFGAAIGLGSISFDEGSISAFGLILTALFVVISMVLVYMLGGYISGRMRRRAEGSTVEEVKVQDGLHGLVVWGLGTILSAFVVAGAITGTVKAVGSAASTTLEAAGTAVGGVAQGAGQLAGGIASGTGQVIGGVAQGAGQAMAPTLDDTLSNGMDFNPIDYISGALLRPSQSGSGPTTAVTGDAQQEVGTILTQLIRTGEINEADKNYLRQVVAAQTGLSPAEVDARVSEAEQRAQAIRDEAEKKVAEAQAKLEEMKAAAQKVVDEAKAKAEAAAEEARVAGILTAFLLAASALVAAAAAYIGAVRGGEHRDEGRIWRGLTHSRR
ncbi:hypothetical protein FNJ84_21260 [Paracoccus sp. M683]|uniref:hypothetical protein n=1 Tax=Paracoccus sp. M683 TaxID=2594268 RepID=UPI00117F450A|nr:hypothetical protein [Paracoccus sp. M683]TRW92044.1 hypothetical protein FNJ84_21260 [Paracoccus sp. M683]